MPEEVPKVEFPEVEIQEFTEVELPKYKGLPLTVPKRIPVDLAHFNEGLYLVRTYNPIFNKLVKLEQDYYKCLYEYQTNMTKMLEWIEKNKI